MTHPQRRLDERVRAVHWAGVPKFRIEAARLGTNTACVDCGETPEAGGLRCVGCFGVAVGRRGPRRKGTL